MDDDPPKRSKLRRTERRLRYVEICRVLSSSFWKSPILVLPTVVGEASSWWCNALVIRGKPLCCGRSRWKDQHAGVLATAPISNINACCILLTTRELERSDRRKWKGAENREASQKIHVSSFLLTLLWLTSQARGLPRNHAADESIPPTQKESKKFRFCDWQG